MYYAHTLTYYSKSNVYTALFSFHTVCAYVVCVCMDTHLTASSKYFLLFVVIRARWVPRDDLQVFSRKLRQGTRSYVGYNLASTFLW